jgi:hypothetical protein
MRRVLIAPAVLTATLLVHAVPARAEARPAPPPVAHAAFSWSDQVCRFAGMGAKLGAKKLIAAVAPEEEEGLVIAGFLVDQLGKKWCSDKLPQVKAMFQQVVVQKPSMREHIGPLAYGVSATVVNGSRADAFTAHWNWYDPTSAVTGHAVAYRLDSGAWVPFVKEVLIVPRGHLVQFAVRVSDADGTSSAWAYSVQYAAR